MQPTETSENSLTAEEAAAVLGISVHALHRLIFTRGLPARESHGHWTIEDSELSQWREANRAALQKLPDDDERDRLTTRGVLTLLRLKHVGKMHHALQQGMPSYRSETGEWCYSREAVLRWFRGKVR